MSSTLSLADADLLRTFHESYVSVDLDIVQTNTLGAGRWRFAGDGYNDGVAEINRARGAQRS